MTCPRLGRPFYETRAPESGLKFGIVPRGLSVHFVERFRHYAYRCLPRFLYGMRGGRLEPGLCIIRRIMLLFCSCHSQGPLFNPQICPRLSTGIHKDASEWNLHITVSCFSNSWSICIWSPEADLPSCLRVEYELSIFLILCNKFPRFHETLFCVRCRKSQDMHHDLSRGLGP